MKDVAADMPVRVRALLAVWNSDPCKGAKVLICHT